MKLIKSTVLFWLLSTLIVVKAQDVKYQLSSYESPNGRKVKGNVDYQICTGVNPEEFYIVEVGKNEYDISIMDVESLKRISSFTVDEPEDGNRDPRWVKFFFHEGKVTIVYAFFNKKTDKYTVYGRISDFEGREIQGETKMMELVTPKKKSIGSISFVLSEDLTKILLFREPPAHRFEKEKMEVALFNTELEEIYEKKMSFPYKYESIYINDVKVSNEGQVLITTEWQQSSGLKKSKNTGEAVNKIFTINEESDELEEIEIAQEGYAFSSMEGYILNDQDKMIFTGFYRDSKSVKRNNDKYKGANGVYYIVLNLETLEVEKRNYDQLNDQRMSKILSANTSEKRGEKLAKKGYGLGNFKIRSLFVDSSGSVVITLEKSYIIENCRTNSQTGITTCTYTYYDMELVEFRLNEEGEIKNVNVIPKKQRTTNGNSMHGIVPLELNGNVYYVFNDNDKNMNPKKRKSEEDLGFRYYFSGNTNMFGGNKKRLVAVSITNYEPSKNSVTPNHKENLLIYPKMGIGSVENHVAIVWAMDPAKHQLSIVKLYLD
ncbi:MAG: hypothetical protein GC181_01105 [Bacteroidetes bacterium]|nr:hypothetical protein [Bacteroidota bacterium]